MKQERNNAIDLMLQKLGRSVSRVPQNSGNGAEANEVHLDADELNAYAENALPKTTRARYTEHLADCARCRQLVFQLSQAAGLIVDGVPESLRVPGWKTFLASLLSPIVLRYAVPALGLLVVASIGFFVLRQSPMSQLAQRRAIPETSKEAPATVAPNNGSVSPSVDHVAKSTTPSETRQQSEKNEQAKLADDAEGKRAKEERPTEKALTSADEVAAAAPANSPAANADAAAPKPAAVEDQKRQVQEVAQNKVQAAPQSGAFQAARANDEPAARRAPKEPPSTVAGLGTVSALKKGKRDSEVDSARGEEADKTKERERADKDETETTSVAGHNFRKSGSVWIDVAYTSNLSTINVTRGSEQYRALIADEPGIRTIAERLHGEVIVVWKGRAYRIR